MPTEEKRKLKILMKICLQVILVLAVLTQLKIYEFFQVFTGRNLVSQGNLIGAFKVSVSFVPYMYSNFRSKLDFKMLIENYVEMILEVRNNYTDFNEVFPWATLS